MRRCSMSLAWMPAEGAAFGRADPAPVSLSCRTNWYISENEEDLRTIKISQVYTCRTPSFWPHCRLHVPLVLPACFAGAGSAA